MVFTVTLTRYHWLCYKKLLKQTDYKAKFFAAVLTKTCKNNCCNPEFKEKLSNKYTTCQPTSSCPSPFFLQAHWPSTLFLQGPCFSLLSGKAFSPFSTDFQNCRRQNAKSLSIPVTHIYQFSTVSLSKGPHSRQGHTIII